MKQIQQFRTLISFLPNQLLKQVELENHLNESIKFNYCDYLSFIKELHYLKLYEACLEFCKNEMTLKGDEIQECGSNHPSKPFLQNKILPILNELYNLIILKYDARIKTFAFSIPIKGNCFCDYIPPHYFKFPHPKSHAVSDNPFTSLQSFKCNGRYDYPYEKLFKGLTKYSKNIKEITLESFEFLEGNLESLKELIVSQKGLQKLELGFLIKRNFSDLFDGLNENSNLQKVRISYCNFNKILPIKILSSCKNLKELNIESSEIGCEQDSLDEINPFVTLNSLKIFKSKLQKEIFNYIISRNSNLEQIIIKGMDLLSKYSNLIPLICRNCRGLKILEIGLTEKSLEKILEVLKYCIDLQELIIHDEQYEIEDLYNFSSKTIDHLSTSQVFRKLGKMISYNLKKLHFTSFYYFFEDDFKEFLINCKINGCLLENLSINICGNKLKIIRMLENYSEDLIINQWDTKNYDGKGEKFNHIITVKFIHN